MRSSLFIPDAAVIAGAPAARIAAFFELFDGLQVVATGALRGIGDTRHADAGALPRAIG